MFIELFERLRQNICKLYVVLCKTSYSWTYPFAYSWIYSVKNFVFIHKITDECICPGISIRWKYTHIPFIYIFTQPNTARVNNIKSIYIRIPTVRFYVLLRQHLKILTSPNACFRGSNFIIYRFRWSPMFKPFQISSVWACQGPLTPSSGRACKSRLCN